MRPLESMAERAYMWGQVRPVEARKWLTYPRLTDFLLRRCQSGATHETGLMTTIKAYESSPAFDSRDNILNKYSEDAILMGVRKWLI